MSGFTSFDPATASTGVTVTNSNLTADALTSAGVIGVRGVGFDALNTGKFYFEFAINVSGNSAADDSVGIAQISASYTNIGAHDGIGGAIVYASSGLAINGSSLISLGGALGGGDVLCFAVDFTDNLLWVRRGAGNWNASGTADPATATGGEAFPAGWYTPIFTMSGSDEWKATLNAGATAFAQSAPSGFTAGWPKSNLLPKNRRMIIG